MGTLSTLGAFGAKALTRAGIGAASGAAAGGIATAEIGGVGALPGAAMGTALSLAPMLLDVIPLIQDLSKGGPDPEKIAAIAKARDARAEQMMGADPSMNRQKATDAANAELKPFIDQASSGGRDAGEIAMDSAALAGTAYLTHKAGGFKKLYSAFGKNTNANVPAPGGPKTESEGINGVDTSTKNLTSTPMPKGADEPEMIHNPTEERAETGFSMNSPRLTMDGPTGGTLPIDREELIRAAMKAKVMQNARGIPGMSNVAIPMGGAPSPMMALGDSMHGQTLNRLDAERMRQMQYGVNGG